jgi:hypothetical protein
MAEPAVARQKPLKFGPDVPAFNAQYVVVVQRIATTRCASGRSLPPHCLQNGEGGED